jgi:outer membrane receptor protein involved in Fe transport
MPSRHLKAALMASSVLVAAGGVAHAQAAEGEVDTIVVTGSRLQSGFQTPTPVTVVGGDSFVQRAPTTVSEVVNELPAFRQSATNSQSQRSNGNGGQNRVDLRGLGQSRTLVLIDGRRFTPTNIGGTVDINMIPTPLVERVEVVTGGASAAYGSDAVSGVVNFILKERIDGIQGSAQYGEAEEGDFVEPAYSLATDFHFAGDRGRVIIGGDWSDNQGVHKIYSRDWGRLLPGLVSFGALPGRGSLPAQGLATGVVFSTQFDGSVVNAGPLKGTAFGPGGVPFQVQYGQVYSNQMIGGVNPAPDSSPFAGWKLVAPHKRKTALVRGTYDLTDNTSAFLEYSYSALDAYTTTNFHQSPSIIVPITNPFIPAATRAEMIRTGQTQLNVGRYDTEVGGLQFLAINKTHRFVGGIKGNIFGDWQWDIYAQHGVTNTDSYVLSNHNQSNWLAATYVVAGPNGQPICGPVATNPNLTGANAARIPNIDPGCVPFNIFGRDSASEAAVAYIKRVSNNVNQYKQDVIAANLAGEPFSTWAGPVAMAAGIEHRRESAFSEADEAGKREVYLSNNGTTYSGEVQVTEGYLEAGVPLARDASFARTLDLNGAVRRTHYSTSGWVMTWKAGLTWEPTDFLRLRGTRSRDIRAANITELFSPGGLGTQSTFVNPVTGQTGPLFTRGGGNPDLTPEKADSLTLGAVFQPGGALRGFRASLDYYDVKIKDVIASVSAPDIARRCADGLQQYCALITFDPTVQLGISLIRTSPANLNLLRTRGFDLELAYRVPLESFGVPGRLEIRSLSTKVMELSTDDGVTFIDRAGTGALGGVPGFTSNLNITYGVGRFTNAFMFRYTSTIRGDAGLIGPDEPGYSPSLPNSINSNRFPGVVYLNWSAQYDLLTGDRRTLQIYGLINNVMDRDPPRTALAAFSFGGNPYDIVGRAFRAGVRFKF